MESRFSAGLTRWITTLFLRHILTFAVKQGWRYTPAGFNFIILVLELNNRHPLEVRPNQLLSAIIVLDQDENY